MAPGAELSQGLGTVWALPAVKDMPAGTRIQETGDAEIMGEVFAGFATAMGTGLMLVLVVLILLFGSVFHSVTILGSLPLAIGGVVAGLYLTNNAISMPVVIGILMLMGIVTKNAIMLVDFAIEEVKHGVPRAEAIIDAGRKRARPIVMTTIAMSAGMVPAAHGARRRRRVPRADGDRGDRRPAGVDLPVAGLRAVLLHDHGRRLDPGRQGVPLAGQARTRSTSPARRIRQACTCFPSGWNRCRSPRSRAPRLRGSALIR